MTAVLRVLCLFAMVGLIAGGLLNDPDFDGIWARFKERFRKRYESKEEETRRRHIWGDAIRRIHEHNLEADLGEHSYTLGLNEFADWTREEFLKYLTGFRPHLRKDDNEPSGQQVVFAATPDSLPKSVNWVDQGWVTSVKNQGKCGCCYTIAAVGALEGQLFKTTQKLESLSFQNLIDCSTTYGNQGCNGGVTDYAFRYVKENGVQSEKSYPYTGKEETCKYDPTQKVAGCSGWVDIPRGNELALQEALATVGPVAVAIDASLSSFQLYRRGVYKTNECGEINHAVLAVGYGTSGSDDYYLIKNSWGSMWGDKGYIKMARNNNNMCGITNQASYPLM